MAESVEVVIVQEAVELVQTGDGAADVEVLIRSGVETVLVQESTVVDVFYPIGSSGWTWRAGVGSPTDDIGRDGDFYHDTGNNAWYGPKSGGTWTSTGPHFFNVTLEDFNVIMGTGVPSDGAGDNGDLYINQLGDPLEVYGPKAAGSWPDDPFLVGFPKDGRTGQFPWKLSDTHGDVGWSPALTISETPPVDPEEGDIWLDSSYVDSNLTERMDQIEQDMEDLAAGSGLDHGGLTGLADDDHTQYALADGSRGDFEVAGAVDALEATLGTAATKNVGTTAGTVAAGDDSRLSDSRAPSGAAGGVLGGTYPNPSFAADMATQAELDAHVAAGDPHTQYALVAGDTYTGTHNFDGTFNVRHATAASLNGYTGGTLRGAINQGTFLGLDAFSWMDHLGRGLFNVVSAGVGSSIALFNDNITLNRGSSGQTADIFQINDELGSFLAKVTAAGNIVLASKKISGLPSTYTGVADTDAMAVGQMPAFISRPTAAVPWHIPGVTMLPTSLDYVVTAGRRYHSIFIVGPKPITLNEAVIECRVGIAASTVRMGIQAATEFGVATGAILWDSGDLATTGTAVQVTANPAMTLQPGVYHMIQHFSHAITVRGYIGSYPGAPITASTNAFPYEYYRDLTYGALTNTGPVSVGNSNTGHKYHMKFGISDPSA